MFVSFADLPVFDQARAKAFYMEKFGCEVIADAAMGPGDWRWVEVRFPGAQTAIHFIRRQNDAPSDGPVMVFMSEDLPATVRSLVSRGVAIVKDVGPAPWNPSMTVAEVDDSEGNRIVLAMRQARPAPTPAIEAPIS